MKPVSITETGCLSDAQESQILRMWNVDVPAGKRPLQQHQHLNFEIMYVNSGSGTYTTAGKNYEMKPGDLFIFSSNEFHCITDVGETGLNITNLQFTPQFMISHTPDIHSKIDINFYFHHDIDFQNRIKSENNEALCQIFRKITEELILQQDENTLMIRALLNLFFVTLLRDYGYADRTHSSNHDRARSIHKAFKYINEHYTENLTLQDIASAAGLSATYFSTVFKKTTGISLWDYINSKRIDKAIQLILSEDHNRNMIFVAEECGFNNTANFNKAFRKYTGMTPREYKAAGYANIS